MKNFKKGAGFRSAPGRENFRSGPSSGATEMFQATCAKCHKDCEVPFRPNGKKPVFCKNCFSADGAASERPRERAPRFDREPRDAGSDLRSQLEQINTKLDTLTHLIAKLSR